MHAHNLDSIFLASHHTNLLLGLCNHQDFAGCGVAVPDRVNMFRVQKLQEMGGNAW